ncbi:hypothetical protein SAMN05660420_03306 [Desulfuromusa kysingii]|uniref:Uncharacterized protein n=1 Tax=Desulfuromusa kysingii TaxID=37625 RepID=A0A1H4ECT1_9BACT|nr:hypothetical protein [Desulfuromusa kysingii]SEA82092.1 hypothetical protein SAMN05660420_03306 [Desulfuromusa kysingii]
MKEILNLALVFFLSSYWLIVPIVFLVVMLFLLGTRKTNKGRWMIATVTLIGVVLMAWYGFGRVAYYDWQVKRLCAIDGGVKVYETVQLPTEKYNKYANKNWILPNKAKAKPSDEYFYEREIVYYHRDNPQVTRQLTRIIRRSDGKVLGEYIRYGRGGGDLPGLWEGSSFSCADIVRPPSFATSIFKEGK